MFLGKIPSSRMWVSLIQKLLGSHWQGWTARKSRAFAVCVILCNSEGTPWPHTILRIANRIQIYWSVSKRLCLEIVSDLKLAVISDPWAEGIDCTVKPLQQFPAVNNSFVMQGYLDELAWAAAWLYKATNKTQYLTDAKVILMQWNFAQKLDHQLSDLWQLRLTWRTPARPYLTLISSLLWPQRTVAVLHVGFIGILPCNRYRGPTE